MNDIWLDFNVNSDKCGTDVKYDSFLGVYYKTKEELKEIYERKGVPFVFFKEPKLHPEMDKLEEYLSKNEFPYSRCRHRFGFSDWDQICVYDNEDHILIWDMVCHEYSYGYTQGLIEIMDHCPAEKGLITEEEREYDSVLGSLTADEIIERIEKVRI